MKKKQHQNTILSPAIIFRPKSGPGAILQKSALEPAIVRVVSPFRYQNRERIESFLKTSQEAFTCANQMGQFQQMITGYISQESNLPDQPPREPVQNVLISVKWS